MSISDDNAPSDAADVISDTENKGGTAAEAVPIPAMQAASPDEGTDACLNFDLDLLREETGSDPLFGMKIHRRLAQPYEHVRYKSLVKEIKDKLPKE